MAALNMEVQPWARRLVLTLSLTMVASAPASAGGPPRLQWELGDMGSSGHMDGPALDARFGSSLILFADKDAALLITDSYGGVVRRLDRRGKVTTIAGTFGASERMEGNREQARLKYPSEMVRLPDGQLVLIEEHSEGLRVLDASGAVHALPLLPGEPMGLDPYALPVEEGADVVVAPAPPAPPVVPSSLVDQRSREHERPTGPLLRAPEGMALDGKGRIWIADSGSYQNPTVIIDAQGQVHPWIPGDHLSLRRIAAGPDGAMWGISESQVFKLYEERSELIATLEVPTWSPPADYLVQPPRGGAVTAVAGQVPLLGRGELPPMPKRPAEMDPPDFQALTIDRQGRPMVVDRRRILRLDPSTGKFTTLLELPPPEKESSYGYGVRSLVVDAGGRTLFTVTESSAVFALDTKGGVTIVAGHSPPTAWWKGDGNESPMFSPLPVRLDDSIVKLSNDDVFYVAKLDHALIRIDGNGAAERWAGTGEKGSADGPRRDAQFTYPSDLAVAGDGTLYIADSGNARIRMVTPQGDVQTLAGRDSERVRASGYAGTASFWEPEYIALDEKRGALYVLDGSPYMGGGDAQIRRLDLRTLEVSTLSAGPERKMYVIDSGERKLAHLNTGPVTYKDIAVGPDGQVYALEQNKVWRIDPTSGIHRTVFISDYQPRPGTNGRIAAGTEDSADSRGAINENCEWMWCNPERIEVDAQGYIYLSDSQNNIVLRISPDGQAGVIAGTPGPVGNRPGTLPGVLDSPGGLALSPEGDLLINVNETGVMRLRNPGQAPISIVVPRRGE